MNSPTELTPKQRAAFESGVMELLLFPETNREWLEELLEAAPGEATPQDLSAVEDALEEKLLYFARVMARDLSRETLGEYGPILKKRLEA